MEYLKIYPYLFFLLGSCFSSATELSQQMMVPISFVKKIEDDFIEKYREAHPTDAKTDRQLRMEIPRDQIRLTVHFKNEGGKPLRSSDQDLPVISQTQIELADILNSGPGLFRYSIGIDSELSEDEIESLRVYFFPRYRWDVNKQGSDAVACDSYIEMTKFFKEKILKKGILMSTKDFSFAKPLLGSYVFLSILPEGLKIASFTLIHDEFSQSRCENQVRKDPKET